MDRLAIAMDGSAVVERTAGSVEASLGEEVVLMKLDSGECIGLGSTGSDVWRLLETPIAVNLLLTRLRDMYDAPEGVIEQDVAEMLGELELHGLITVHPPQLAGS